MPVVISPNKGCCVQVLIDVQQNPFEKHRVAVVAECYMEALALEGLPQDMTDELRLPDQPLNQQGSSTFVLRNLSDKPYRYAIGIPPNFRDCDHYCTIWVPACPMHICQSCCVILSIAADLCVGSRAAWVLQ